MPSRATIFCILFLFYLLLLLLYFILHFTLYIYIYIYSNFTQICYGIARRARVQSGSFLLIDYVYNESDFHKEIVPVEVQNFRHGTRWPNGFV